MGIGFICMQFWGHQKPLHFVSFCFLLICFCYSSFPFENTSERDLCMTLVWKKTWRMNIEMRRECVYVELWLISASFICVCVVECFCWRVPKKHKCNVAFFVIYFLTYWFWIGVSICIFLFFYFFAERVIWFFVCVCVWFVFRRILLNIHSDVHCSRIRSRFAKPKVRDLNNKKRNMKWCRIVIVKVLLIDGLYAL